MKIKIMSYKVVHGIRKLRMSFQRCVWPQKPVNDIINHIMPLEMSSESSVCHWITMHVIKRPWMRLDVSL
jgi:hypothetical protein